VEIRYKQRLPEHYLLEFLLQPITTLFHISVKTRQGLNLPRHTQNALAGTAINLTSAGSGTLTLTKTAEPRYSGAFVIDSEQEIGENIKDIISGMIGTLTYSHRSL
jgi:hypothetical protein